MTVVAQLSDVHVRPKGLLYQNLVDSNAMLVSAVEAVNRLRPAPDAVLITGDLTDDGSPEAYAMLKAILGRLEPRYLLMPGNHDDRRHLREAFPDQPWPSASGDGPLNFAFDIGAVHFLALDTTVPGFHHGELDRSTLAWLGHELGSNKGRRCVVAMHHPPFSTGIPYLDKYGLRDPAPFRDLISRHDNIDRIIAGHVHRTMQTRIGAVPVSTCPSTTTQIALRVHEDALPASYLEPAAFLLHRWAPDTGEGVTHLSYVGQFEGPFPFA